MKLILRTPTPPENQNIFAFQNLSIFTHFAILRYIFVMQLTAVAQHTHSALGFSDFAMTDV